MSGRNVQKLREHKMIGWEEAGSEFYQETYPCDWEGFTKNAASIATLLPSVQNRIATTRRKHCQTDQKCPKRKQENIKKFHSTAKLGSYSKEIHTAMMPDLSQDLTDEESIWEEMKGIKAMTVPMSQKKEIRIQLKNATKLRIQGFDNLKWKKRKMIYQLGLKTKNLSKKLKCSSRNIEEKFGTGILTYFLFLRWLIIFNIISFSFFLYFIILPTITAVELVVKPLSNISQANNSSQIFDDFFPDIRPNFLDMIQMIQGEVFQNTCFYYGFYTNVIKYHINHLNSTTFSSNVENLNKTIDTTPKSSYDQYKNSGNYNLSLAYLLTNVIYFLTFLIATLKKFFQYLKRKIVKTKDMSVCCNIIFGGWDFCITGKSTSNVKHKAFSSFFKKFLLSKKFKIHRMWYTTLNLIAIRVLIHAIVFTASGLSTISIFFLLNRCFEIVQKSKITYIENKINSHMKPGIWRIDTTNVTHFFYEFLPYFAIVCYNELIPQIFNCFCNLERYSKNVAAKVFLFRVVAMKFSYLIALIIHFYILTPKDYDGHIVDSLECWETYVGQQIYKLVITDLSMQTLKTFLINFPRSLLHRHANVKLSNIFAEQRFELANHVSDVIFFQVYSLIGSFYCPFLPFIVGTVLLILFYIKKFHCIFSSEPSTELCGASESYSILIIMCIFSCSILFVPMAFIIFKAIPSKSCGPFRGLKSLSDSGSMAYTEFPVLIKIFLSILTSYPFILLFTTISTFFFYYYYTLATSNKRMVLVLKNHLILEGHDKQFLLNRLSFFMKQSIRGSEEQTLSQHKQGESTNQRR